ncbi:unnamed protein product (macronuclear) [Paramecium tetraurelia]|uniref:Uncharacterized protein n=1 Tax=Paramecium tetraurelia TaxID=5888 RepID=A0DG18_PARTE|nr:uncharacterized protein GSPATT00002113001 [Paramecium tetraurelia]CAK81985.1 unnamed protein product [Paramecium tetraurelia]|eukprot:XP_001449382.1 hypothetical protein (macronuclear) [Paramecium tetraurelia strain d4-2]
MKFLLISIALLSLQVNSLNVISTSTCTCQTVQVLKDCLMNPKCEWDSTTQKCKDVTTTGTTSRFVSKLCTDSKTCAKQQGCAFSDNKCLMMGDCQSYLGSSNAECQKYSYRCNYNKELQTCTSSDVCGQYGGEGKQTDCESVTQQNGDKLCKFDTTSNKCSKKVCTDYEKTTDADCAAVLQDANCVSDKKKCLSSLASCSSYSADLCLSITASDGPCEQSSDKTKCQARTCEGATDSKADTNCDAYLKGCITNNLTCVKTLPSCSTYKTTDCTQLKGNKGTCVLTTGETPTCRDPICEDLSEVTDDACKAKNTSCVTNGVNCVSVLAAKCQDLSANCDSVFTKEGKCKSGTDTKCVLDACEDQSKTTNEECGKFAGTDSPTCVTNGVFCVKSLSETCATTKISDSTSCDQYISKEGKCKAKTGSTTTCELNSCNTQTFTTDEDCKKYSSHDLAPAVNCRTTGLKCVDNLNTCNSYSKDDGCSSLKGSDGSCMDDATEGSTKCTVVTCDKIASPSATSCPAGNTTCKFDGVACIKELKTCESYTSNCDNIIPKDSTLSCTTSPTDSTKCTTKTCATAPTSLSTDVDCIKYKVGCFTTGQGCIALLSTCDTYKGIKSSCEKYIGTDGKCTADDANKAEDKCKAKDCANATSVTNDQQCNTYSNVCFYSAKIQKCSKKVATCSVQKTQTDCENSITKEASVYCNWNGAACVPATCNTIQNVKSKEACAVFGSNCEFDNLSGCKDKTNYPCSALRQASVCLQDSAQNACVWDYTNSVCITYNKCTDFQLTPAKENEVKTATQIAAETEICKLLSTKCYSNGGNTCVYKTPCTVIKEEKSCIGSIGIDDKACGYDAKATACKTFGQCTDVELLTHAECQKYSTTCTTDGKTCVAIKNCSDATAKEICDLGGIDGKCSWTDNACTLWSCDKGTGTTHETCNKQLATCTTDGTKCIAIQECSAYTSDKSCVLGLKSTPCFYDKDKSACRNKVCSDYTNVTAQADCDSANCAYDPEAKACIAIDKCSAYKKEGVCNANINTDKKGCVWKVGSTSSSTSGCLDLNYCSNASSNEAKCKSINCYFVAATTTGTTTTESQCKDMDCYGNNQQVTTKGLCKPYTTTSTDGKTKNIYFCIWNDTSKKCIDGDPSGELTADNCFTLSQYTYYWSTTSSKCVSCKGGNTSTNNTTNSTNSTNDSTTTTDSYGIRLELIICILLLFQLI